MAEDLSAPRLPRGADQPVRVILVNRFFCPDESATSLMLTDLVRALGPQPYECRVVTGAAHYAGSRASLPPREVIGGALVHRLPALKRGQSSLLRRLANFLLFYLFSLTALLRLARRGDVVVCLTDPPFGQLLCLAAAKAKGARLVNWVQDIYPETAVRLGYGSRRNPLFVLLAALRDRCWRASAANVAIGARMAEYIAQRTGGAARVRIIPNWADEAALAPLAPADNPLRRAWGYAESDCVIGYSGNLGRAHDSETMLGAIAQLAEDPSPPAHFLFVGGGAQRSAIEARLGACEMVRFRAYQPRGELRASLSVPDVHWLSLAPQLEGLIVPSKFYGATAAGRPVIFIGDEDGEIARLIAEGECGCSFAPGASEALARYLRILAQDPALRQQLGRKARAFAEQICSREARLGEWAALLGELTTAQAPPARSGAWSPPLPRTPLPARAAPGARSPRSEVR